MVSSKFCPTIDFTSSQFPAYERQQWICFEKSADSAYFIHNGGQSTLSGKGKVDFF